MAQEPFSSRVASEQWRSSAIEWIEECLARASIRVTGPIEQPRIRAWSTHMTVPTDVGRVWFKATCPAMGFEPALQSTIARLVPGAVPDPLATDVERGWMLTRDHGPALGDEREPTLQDWRSALAEAARVQRLLADHREELLATGLPDAGPETVVARFDRLLDVQEQSPPDHGGRVSTEVVKELRARRGELADACAELMESAVPSTWQHGDLHPWNLYDAGGTVAFFDLGDGMWSHAAEILAVPYGIVTDRGGPPWDDIVSAWTQVWEVDRADFDRMWRACGFTHAVNRAITWHRALMSATLAEVEQWGDQVEKNLASMVDL